MNFYSLCYEYLLKKIFMVINIFIHFDSLQAWEKQENNIQQVRVNIIGKG